MSEKGRSSDDGTEKQEQKKNRIAELARHRTLVPDHRPDRRSVYWVEKEPTGPPTVMAMTPRLEILSQYRNIVPEYRFNRDKKYHIDTEPFYREIKRTNKDNIPEATPRITQLSGHKTTNGKYQYDRELPCLVTPQSEATPRLVELSRSKTELWEKKGGWPNEKTFHTSLPQPVSAAAMKASVSARVDTLAEHKAPPNGFQPEKPVRWLINEEALKLNASIRLCQLARPRSRTMIRDDNFDPYLVSRAARYAQITPRTEELSVPLPRKQRSKRVVVA